MVFMKTKHLLAAPLVALFAVAGLTACGSSDTAAETCDKIEVFYDEQGSDPVEDLNYGSEEDRQENLATMKDRQQQWESILKSASDDELSSAMEDVNFALQEYIAYGEDDSIDVYPGDRTEVQTQYSTAQRAIIQAC